MRISSQDKGNLGKANKCIDCNREMVHQTSENQEILERMGNSLKGHTKNKNNQLAEIEEIEEENILTPAHLDRKYFIQAELSRLLEEEELYSHKRSNENWLLKGDNNTDYFHKKANGEKKEKHYLSN
jgi:hypothetical protein